MSQGSPKKPLAKVLKTIISWLFSLLFLVYLFIWIFSPPLARWQINKNLAPLNVQLSDDTSIRLNPFLLKLSIWELQVLTATEREVVASIGHAEIDVDGFALFSNQIEIQQFLLAQVSVETSINEQHIKIAGVTLVDSSSEPPRTGHQAESPKPDNAPPTAQAPEKNSWNIKSQAVNLDAFDFNLTYHGKPHRFSVNQLVISNILVSEDLQQAEIDLEAAIDGSPLNLTSLLKLSKDSREIESQFSIESLDLSKYAYLADNRSTISSGELSVSLRNRLVMDKSHTSIALEDLNLQLDSLVGDSNNVQMSLQKLTQSIKNATINMVDSNLTIESTSLNTQLEQLAVAPANSPDKITEIEKIALNNGNFRFNNEQEIKANLADLIISNATISQFAPRENSQALPSLAKFASLNISGIEVSENQLVVNAIVFDELTAEVVLDKNKQLANLVLPERSGPAEEEQQASDKPANPQEDDETLNEPAAGEPKSNAYAVQLNHFKINENSRLSFADQSVLPNFTQALELKKVTLENINTQDFTAITNFDILVKTDEFAETRFNGNLLPFSEKLNLSLKGEVKEFSLPKVSPYLKGAMGFEMLSGQFDTEIDLSVVDDEIKGKTLLKLRGIELSSADEQSAESDNQQSTTGAMPLNSALGMLKDDNGNVELEVPLSGNVSDPNFGVSNFIALVSKKAIMAAAQSYLMETFIPYANVLSVVMAAGDYMLKVSIEPLNYQPNQLVLLPEQMDYMNQLVQLMKDQPESQLKVCSIASVNDMPGVTINLADPTQTNQLNQISEERAQAFKRWMVEQGGVESARLLLCQPQFDKDPKSVPRIEFEL
ncbi:DUF748 domain-containing protein [Aliikangiella marina]|uniref:DUF748 domain-containing protein n=1 Tax=Aliikangiella marina TaxID=1712262 RepID=A0A545T915_9GAMM|nr:DUF748 domain-containing protein [Aliikangiella marina]TQV73716.1 DUF748 domain-containing protein [Aliikangiella marina]